MPIFVAMLLSGLVELAASMVGRVLIAAGVGLVSYVGIDTLIGQLTTDVFSRLDAVGGNFSGILGLLKIGSCVNVLLSAYTIRMTLSGLTGGTVKRWVTK